MAELKYVLKHFGYRVGGKKSVLQSRAIGMLRLKGSSKVGAVIQQIPRVAYQLVALNNSVQSKHPLTEANSCQCTVKFKEPTFYTNVDTLVKSTRLGISFIISLHVTCFVWCVIFQ